MMNSIVKKIFNALFLVWFFFSVSIFASLQDDSQKSTMVSEEKKSEAKPEVATEPTLPMQEPTVEFVDSGQNLREKILSAKKRYQPYINLTNQIYVLGDLLEPSIFNDYKELALKSIYLRTKDINLDAQFATELNELVKTGIKEVFIFFHQEQAKFATEQFNQFLKENKIYINIRMVPVSNKDIEDIRKDAIGKRDILGFKKISEGKIHYQDGFSLVLLNNDESDRIVSANYAEHVRGIVKGGAFVLKEPDYITSSANKEAEKRNKSFLHTKDDFGLQLEISKNIDLSEHFEQQAEKESELDLDREQAENKFNKPQAIDRAEKLSKQFFYEEDQKRDHYKPRMDTLVTSLFNSASDMEFITSKALEVVVLNYYLFRDGIDIDNLPIGLAYKDHILFVSDQRLSSMPIDDFTVRLNPIKAHVSNPLAYSWLHLATNAAISLNDIYGSDIAPRVYGSDKHPLLDDWRKVVDIMLDIPFNFYNRGLGVFSNLGARDFNDFFAKDSIADKRDGIEYYNLSVSDQKKLDEIYSNLEQRGALEVFNKIIRSGYIPDGGFLLEERASLFFKKLFQEILPLVDAKKQRFFKEVLAEHEFASNSLLEDVFEGLDGFYKKLNEFIIENKIAEPFQEKIFAQSIAIIKRQMEYGTSFKVSLGRFINILKLALSRGGNLAEQLEYLDSVNGGSLLKDSGQYRKAKELGLNTIHPALALHDMNFAEISSITEGDLVKHLFEEDFVVEEDYEHLSHDLRFIFPMWYLATVPPHQRPSIATYSNYFHELDNKYKKKSFFCTTERSYDSNPILSLEDYMGIKSLKTREYVLFEDVPYQYEVESFTGFRAIYVNDVNLPLLQSVDKLGEEYFLFIVDDDELHLQIKAKSFEKRVKFAKGDLSKEQIKLFSTKLGFAETKDKIVIVTLAQLEAIFSNDIFAQIKNKIFDDPETMQALMENASVDGGNKIESKLRIIPEGGSYNLYYQNNDHSGGVSIKPLKFPKGLLDTPASLDEKVRQCVEDGKRCSGIELMPSELKGSAFELFAEPFVNQHWFYGKSYEEKTELLAKAPKEIIQHSCYASCGVVAPDCSLVEDFTTKQAAENVKLLSLNILSSIGGHYDPLYPDQEMTEYLSLFNVLFTEVKIYHDIEFSTGSYIIEQDLNRNSSYARPKHPGIKEVPKEVEDREKAHKKIVGTFTGIYKENPVFNFTQVVALGLVDILDHNLTEVVINRSKELLQYNGYFTQMLRVLLSTPAATIDVCNSDLGELLERTKAIVKVIDQLFIPMKHDNKDALAHTLITQNGKHPENLVFFAACFGQEKEIDENKINLFLSKTKALDSVLKDQLFESLVTTQLPYASGKIISNQFPVMTLEDLEHPDVIRHKIEMAKKLRISSVDKTKFNDANVRAIELSQIDFNALADKHNLSLPDELKSKRFSDIRKNILEDKEFIKVNFFHDLDDQDAIKKISSDLAVAIFSVFSSHNIGWKDEVQKSMAFLFNPEKRLEEQFLGIESSYPYLLELLGKCKDAHEKEQLLDYLLAEPKIPYHARGRVLAYLNSLDCGILKTRNYTLPLLVKNAGNKIIGQYFDIFALATDGFIKSDIGIDLEKLYRLLESLADAKYNNANIKTITEYCLKHKNYSIIPVLAKLDGEADHIDEIVSWMVHVSPQHIERLDDLLGDNFKTVLAIKEIKKIKIIMDLALKLNSDLSQKRYSLLIEHIMKHDVDYATLISSYLLVDQINGLPQKDKIDIIFDKLDHPEMAQNIFSQHNLARFNYDHDRVLTKIKEVIGKNTSDGKGKSLVEEEQTRLYYLFTRIMGKAAAASVLNSNEIRSKVIELKHRRMLLKKDTVLEREQIDVDYLALSFEALYRTTGKFPRDTQILSVLIGITNPNHIIEEIATGQGKSIITAPLYAAYLCFTGQTVDVVSSSQELAEKDRQEFAPFYQGLGLASSRSIITANSEINVYMKGGINYAIASDLALFRANREFYSNTTDLELNTDVSLIADEVDFALTSGINYKLASALVKTTQEEARVLFGYIIDFSSSPIFKNDGLGREDDVKNLKLCLDYQFQQYNSSYRYPLSLVQVNELMHSSDLQAQKLYILHSALSKAGKRMDQLFDKLLSAVVTAQKLVEGKDYVILKEDINNKEKLLQVTPIIKDQPSKGTVFGEGVQPFLHLLAEKNHPDLKQRFDVSIPSYTVFNVSPKNFFDYYRLAGGKIIGLTGTAGSKEDIEEFREKNKMLAFNIPRYEEDKKIITREEVANKEEQYKKVHTILDTLPSDRPIIIFSESTKEAEQVFQEMNKHRPQSQLYAASQQDTASLKEILDNASKNGSLTITTPMLGRGTDFYTSYPQGFLAINLCTDITYSTLMQIYGRVARNGHPGEVKSLFNREQFGTSVESHMLEIAENEKQTRMKSQPLTDVLRYFNHKSQDNTVNAIKINEFITEVWDKLLKDNYSQLAEGKKSYSELRDELVVRLKERYPILSQHLERYLEQLDGGVPNKIDGLYPKDSSSMECGLDGCNLDAEALFDYHANNEVASFVDTCSAYSFPFVDTCSTDKPINDIWWQVDSVAPSIPASTLKIPDENDPKPLNLFYSAFYKAQYAIMDTHAFHLQENKFKFYPEYEYSLSFKVPEKDDILPNQFMLFLDKDKIYGQMAGKVPKAIAPGYSFEEGIPQNIYDSILSKLQTTENKNVLSSTHLIPEEKAAVSEHINEAKYHDAIDIGGEGSSGDLMLYEFKKSFAAYRKVAKSKEVEQIASIIDNFKEIADIDTAKLREGQYYAARITTLFTSSSSHAEAILVYGKLLFWVNRGGGSGADPGIKIFKIIRDIADVKAAFDWMKTPRSETDTRAKIYSLLREDADNNVPEHVYIRMPEQTIGNCGWTQTEGMLKIAAVVNRLENLKLLNDNVYKNPEEKIWMMESQKWQKILKDSEDIYVDFITYDQVKRLEATIFSMDQAFKTIFLSKEEQDEIDLRREKVGNPTTYQLLERLGEQVKHNHARFDNTIYEKQVRVILDRIDLEVAVGSKMGKSLQRVVGERGTRDILMAYQKNKQNNFGYLNKIYKKIDEGKVTDKQIQDKIFITIINDIVDKERTIFLTDEFIDSLISVAETKTRLGMVL